ncbi:hypothetical protein C0V82_19890 [Niveispirillum cyanobacteriorum]|uniref:Uncharacterized protein n=1 Tax=Niveispirillum cyanobacteriorum TaxID=1612173 RepID=A0A2K9NHM9_9PROT|nr:hypothetical protein C0V82_19890 [Niveispirillum cyanobacteriorum]
MWIQAKKHDVPVLSVFGLHGLHLRVSAPSDIGFGKQVPTAIWAPDQRCTIAGNVRIGMVMPLALRRTDFRAAPLQDLRRIGAQADGALWRRGMFA